VYGYIYKRQNTINGKIYIGKHQYDKPELDENYRGSGKLLNYALCKYGEDNITYELICCADSLQELNKLEQFNIEYFDCLAPKGYNLTRGGDGGDVYSYQTDEWKQAHRERCSKAQSELVYIHKNNQTKRIRPNEVKMFEADGWEAGRYFVPSEESNQHRSEKLTGTFYVNKDGQNRRITSEELNKFISSGYTLGYYVTSNVRSYNEQRALLHQQKLLEKELQWYEEEQYCKTCGKLMLSKWGNGDYCSKSCAATHPHTQETKDLLREMNQAGICGMKGKHLTDEQKANHSKSMVGKNKGQRWITNGVSNKRIDPSEFSQYEAEGFWFGRTVEFVPWNKGLTIEDERVKKNVESRNETMLSKYGTLNTNIFKRSEKK
jgi:hypothetical protein